jgi:hypothetical protein
MKKGREAGRQTSTSDSLMFVKELFSLVTLQAYPYNNDSIYET